MVKKPGEPLMNFKRYFPNSVLIIMAACLLSVATDLAAGPLKVYSAEPKTGVQGQPPGLVTINGVGFATAESVRFLVSGTSDTGGVAATLEGIGGDGNTLVAKVVIPDNATVAYYDIEVQLSGGRKGKGTSKFSVQAKPNQEETVHCMNEFFPDELMKPDTNVKCDCEFTAPGENWPHYGMLRDCYTSATLQLKTYPIVNPSSSTPDGTEMATLTAVLGKNESPFQGTSVISNTTDRRGVRFLNIRFAADVARGCDQELKSAISFVLDEDTDNPETNSGLNVADVTIDTEGNGPLCTAIEIRRFTVVDAVGNLDGAHGYVDNVTIAEGSYEQFGIHYDGMQPSGSLTKQVFGNYIGAPACDHAPDTAAIQIGNVILTDPFDQSSQNPVVAESNIIRMENSGCANSGPVGVGIRVVGEPENSDRLPIKAAWRQTTVDVVKNVISGATVGVEVDSNVLNVKFSGNTLIGDPNDDFDIGICTEALNTSTKGKPNVWSGYGDDDKILYTPCL
jgi:hypothetical protein